MAKIFWVICLKFNHLPINSFSLGSTPLNIDKAQQNDPGDKEDDQGDDPQTGVASLGGDESHQSGSNNRVELL